MLAVALENARRYYAERSGPASEPRARGYIAVLAPRRHPAPYVLVAWVMLTGAGLGLLLWLLDVITLFGLEILVTALFAVFWTVQTVEQSGDRD